MILTRPIVVISIAPIVKVIRREFINEIPLSLKNFATNPLARHPKSAMRNGSHTNMAISFRLKCSVSTKKTGTQKLIVPHAGSAKKREIPIPQKFLCFRMLITDVFLFGIVQMLFLTIFNI